VRKSAASVEEAKSEIKRRVKRGPRAVRRVSAEQSLHQFEREIKREMACHYKASDFSYGDIADALGLTRDIIKKWFQEPEMQARCAKIVEDMVGSAVKFGQLASFEMLEIIADVARSADDDKTAIQAACEYLDRIGLTKVNKSESKSASTIKEERELNLVDKDGIIDALADNAPPEVLQRAATLMDELFSLTAEHTDKDVTHANS
jgi:hypothetical protein